MNHYKTLKCMPVVTFDWLASSLDLIRFWFSYSRVLIQLVKSDLWSIVHVNHIIS